MSRQFLNTKLDSSDITSKTSKTHKTQKNPDVKQKSIRKENRTEQSEKQIKNLLQSSGHHSSKSVRTHFSFFPLNASLTLETAIALPLFIFMVWLLLFPLKVMEAERKLQNSMESVGKKLAVAEYLETTGEEYLNEESKYKDTVLSLIDGVEEGAALAVILADASAGPFRNCIFSPETAVFSKEEGADSDLFYAKLNYELELPFSLFEIAPVKKSLVVNRRAWTGSDGGRGRSKYGEELEDVEEEEDPIVYLGKTSVVYHLDPNCHYLSNKMSMADASVIGDLRNESGGKYHPCPSCKPGKSGIVYYFADGTAYHSSEHCKAITAYARAVHLSEVEGMPPCSYCGKKH